MGTAKTDSELLARIDERMKTLVSIPERMTALETVVHTHVSLHRIWERVGRWLIGVVVAAGGITLIRDIFIK